MTLNLSAKLCVECETKSGFRAKAYFCEWRRFTWDEVFRWILSWCWDQIRYKVHSSRREEEEKRWIIVIDPKNLSAQLWTHSASGLSHPSHIDAVAKKKCLQTEFVFRCFPLSQVHASSERERRNILGNMVSAQTPFGSKRTVRERRSKINAFNRKLFLLFSALRGLRTRFVRFHATHHSLITFHNNLSVIIIVFVAAGGVWRRKTFACGAFGMGRWRKARASEKVA